MKKHLKKVTALALAALTVTSASSVGFAAECDVDTDGFTTANDAALVHFYANNADYLDELDNSEALNASMQKNGAAFVQSVLQGGISARDASRILGAVNDGNTTIADMIAADYQKELNKALNYYVELAKAGGDASSLPKSVKPSSLIKVEAVTDASGKEVLGIGIKNKVARNEDGTYDLSSGNVKSGDTALTATTITQEALLASSSAEATLEVVKNFIKEAVTQVLAEELKSIVDEDVYKGLTEYKVEEIENVEAIEELVENIVPEEGKKNEITTSSAIVFEYGTLVDEASSTTSISLSETDLSAIRVEADNSGDNVLDKLNEAMSNEATKTSAKTAVSQLLKVLKTFEVNGKSVGTEEGWKLLGDKLATNKNAFADLYTEDVNDDYIGTFVQNYKNAFASGDSSKLNSLNIVSSGNISLICDGKKVTDPKEVIKTFADKVLYASGTSDSYKFNSIAFGFGDGKAFVIEKTITTKVTVG